jgi:hypothetical protein
MKKQGNQNINSLKDLHAAMHEVQLRIKEREEDLGKRWKQLPGETINASLGAILPFILGNQIGSGAWKLLKGAFDFVKGKYTQSGEKVNWQKSGIVAGAAQIGLTAVIKLVSGLLKKKAKGPETT